MEDMKAKAITEKDDEMTRFSAFKQWCGDTEASKKKAIEDASNTIEKMAADIMKAEEEIETANARVAELQEDVGRWEVDAKAAADVRAKEKADYKATLGDLTDVVDACGRAVIVLQKEPDKVRQEADLVQLANKKQIPEHVRVALLQYAKQPEGEWEPNRELLKPTGAANAYDNHSDPIVKMLKDLKMKFQQQINDLEKEELIAKHGYETVAQRLADQTEEAEREISAQKKFSAERSADKAEPEGEKADAETVKAESSKYLGEMQGMCMQKNADFENRQVLRGEEIEAINKAIEIMGGDKINSEHLPSALQTDGATALVQMLRAAPAGSDALKKVAALLQDKAATTGSKELALLAQKAREDPFAKVKKMIQDMITRLLEEAASESDHKAWCDAELGTNEKTRQIKTEEVDELMAKVDSLKAEQVQLMQEVEDLQAEIKELNEAVAKATAERSEEKAKNEATIADAKESQTATAQALAVLRDFYAKAATATSLAQQTPGEDAPETFDGAYKGMGAESGGVIGMLEVIESDFSRLEVTTTSNEAEAVSQFKAFKAASEQDVAVAQAEVDHKTGKVQTVGEMLSSANTNLEQTQKQLDAAKEYYEKLKPSCVDAGMSFEERVQMRNDELQTLKEAYKILSGEDIPSFQDMKAEQSERFEQHEG